MRDLEVPLDGAALSAVNTPETPAPSAIGAAVRTLEAGGYGARDLANTNPDPNPKPKPNPYPTPYP